MNPHPGLAVIYPTLFSTSGFSLAISIAPAFSFIFNLNWLNSYSAERQLFSSNFSYISVLYNVLLVGLYKIQHSGLHSEQRGRLHGELKG